MDRISLECGDSWHQWRDSLLADSNQSSFASNGSKLQPFCLSFLQANFFASVLEETIKEIRVLGECNNHLRIIKTNADMPVLRRRKFGVKEPDVIDELDDIDPKRLDCPDYKLNKLAADRTYFEKVITDTFLCLALNNCYTPLTEAVAATENLNAYRIHLAEETNRNKLLRREIWRQVRQQRNHYKSVTYDTNSIIDSLQKQVQDASLMSEITGRYIDNWQNARTEQHVEFIAVTEAGPSDSIAYYGQRTDHERRVHSEVELITSIMMNETLAKVEYWMNKYDEDMEAVDLKIQIKRNDYQKMLEKRMHYEEVIAEHKMAIQNWLKFKEEREIKRQYVAKMTESAIIVQAWWRGLIVRLELGPFKPKKGKKGKGKTK